MSLFGCFLSMVYSLPIGSCEISSYECKFEVRSNATSPNNFHSHVDLCAEETFITSLKNGRRVQDSVYHSQHDSQYRKCRLRSTSHGHTKSERPAERAATRATPFCIFGSCRPSPGGLLQGAFARWIATYPVLAIAVSLTAYLACAPGMLLLPGSEKHVWHLENQDGLLGHIYFQNDRRVQRLHAWDRCLPGHEKPCLRCETAE